MGASSPMGSCSSLADRRSAGEGTVSSCSLDHGQSCRQSEEVTVCLVARSGALEPRRKAAHHCPRCYWVIADRSVRGMRCSRTCGLRRHRASVYQQAARRSSNGESGTFRRWHSGRRDGRSLIIDTIDPACLDPATHQGRYPRPGCAPAVGADLEFLGSDTVDVPSRRKTSTPTHTHPRVDDRRDHNCCRRERRCGVTRVRVSARADLVW